MEEQTNEKKRAGQSGHDGNTQVRDQRIYLRASAQEKSQLRKLAEEAGFDSLARFIRQRALYGSDGPYERSGEHLAWLGTVNRIANYVDEIAKHLEQGKKPDEDLLLLVMQISDMAEKTLKEVRIYNERAIAGTA